MLPCAECSSCDAQHKASPSHKMPNAQPAPQNAGTPSVPSVWPKTTLLPEACMPLTWCHAKQVGDMGSGDLMVLAGTSTGNVSRLRLQAPLAPGADPSEVQVEVLLSTCSSSWASGNRCRCQWIAGATASLAWSPAKYHCLTGMAAVRPVITCMRQCKCAYERPCAAWCITAQGMGQVGFRNFGLIMRNAMRS